MIYDACEEKKVTDIILSNQETANSKSILSRILFYNQKTLTTQSHSTR